MVGRFVACAVVSLVLESCGSTKPVSTTLRILDKSELTAAEIKYGRAPRHDRAVIYERDVIIIDGGPDVIRSVTPDGLTWMIDARAGHAAELKVGNIAFVTGRCVGRVLAAKRERDNLSLVLGPVELTDIFRKLDVTLEQPIALGQMLEYPNPHFPGVEFPLEGDVATPPEWSVVPPRIAPAAWSSPPARTIPFFWKPVALGLTAVQQQLPGAPGILPIVPPLKWHTKPLVNADGIGVDLRHESTGLRVIAQVQMRLERPRLDFHLSIEDKKVEARVILKNAAGLRVAFDAAGNEAFAGTVDWYAPAPGVLTIPLSGPAGLHVDVRQGIWVRTVFSARQTMFSAGGDYVLNGDIGFTFHDGKFEEVGPKGLTVRQSLMSNMSGVSMGPAGMVISHQVTITAGVGFWQFTTGPTADIGTSVGVAQGSSIGIVNCRGANITMNVRGGVGWTIPRPIVEVVNFFLRIVGVKQVQDHGGIHTKWLRLFQQQAQTESPVCGGAGG
jgi:hypothetical protein